MIETAIQISLTLQEENKTFQAEHDTIRNELTYQEMEAKQFNLKFQGFPQQRKEHGLKILFSRMAGSNLETRERSNPYNCQSISPQVSF